MKPDWIKTCRVCGWPFCLTSICALCEERAAWREAEKDDRTFRRVLALVLVCWVLVAVVTVAILARR